MHMVTGTYRDGKVELDQVVDWPDGMRVTVAEEDPADELLREEDWPDTPEARDEMLRRVEEFEPVILSLREEAEIAAARQAVKQYTIEAVRKQMGPK
jgi:hypothetical protein